MALRLGRLPGPLASTSPLWTPEAPQPTLSHHWEGALTPVPHPLLRTEVARTPGPVLVWGATRGLHAACGLRQERSRGAQGHITVLLLSSWQNPVFFWELEPGRG